jgi:zinc transporter 13
MSKLKLITVLLVLVLSLVVKFGDAEIHRAVKNKQQYTSRYHEKRTHDTKLTRGYSTETWVCAMISAALVGLSGIFPLAVIPLEAGKALRKGESAARLKLLLSFAVGGLLGDVFLHLLPEAWAHIGEGADRATHISIGLWVLTGLLAFLVVEKIFPDGEDDEEEEDVEEKEEEEEQKSQTEITDTTEPQRSPRQHKSSPRQRKDKKQIANGIIANGTVTNGKEQNGFHKKTSNGTVPYLNGHANGIANGHANGVANGHCNGVVANGVHKKEEKQHQESAHIKTSGWLNLMANVVDNFTHGLAVAASYCVSTKVGFVTTIAILLHEIPHEIGDFAILLRSGFDRWRAAKCQLLTASGGLLGAITALTAESAQAAGDSTAWILPFTSGGFIYIAMVTVIPDLLKETCPKESLKQMALIVAGIATMAGVTLMA